MESLIKLELALAVKGVVNLYDIHKLDYYTLIKQVEILNKWNSK